MPAPSHPLVIAHRGASASAPENTLAAYALAVAQDADGIELDVRRTADGHLVLHHDPVVPGLGAIVELTLGTLRCRAPSVPTLDEMLAVTGDLLIDIEIKNDPGEPDHDPAHTVADAVAGWIARHDLHHRVIVSSFDWGTTARIRHTDPRIATGQLVAVAALDDRMLAAVANEGHAWALPADHLLGAEPEVAIAAGHRHGLQVGTWTVDGAQRLRRLAEAGIDAIVVNDPAAAVTALT